jgi:tRNA pseudouridine55 synthase
LTIWTTAVSAARTATGLHGYLAIDKPAGWTSHDVVGRLRRLLGERRIGHAGTLDPAATGVLPVAIGAATKTLEYLAGASKTYVAEVTFGVETDSYDADGVVTSLHDASRLTLAAVERVVGQFLGPQLQVPPMHSAIRIGGRRLYEAARRGEEVERPPRPVVFYTLELLDWRAPSALVLVDCSKGTYIRSLARDIGHAVGTGAHLSDLVRTRSGPFTLCQAWTLSELARVVDELGDDLWALWSEVATHPDLALLDRPAVVLDAGTAVQVRNGRTVAASPGDDGVPDGLPCRAYDEDGTWLGVVGWDARASAWRSVKITA